MEDKEKITNGEAVDERTIPAEMSLISIPERGLSIEKELAEIEKNVAFFNRVKIVALKMTKPSDWVDMGGPYLMDRGAENVAIAFGVDISDLQLKMEWAEDQKGRYYTFIASGKAYAKKLGRYVEDIGVCSQRDKFFGMMDGKFKEIAEVDMANIRRKAVTNLYSRLIKRVIGLMGVTFDDLGQAGIKRESLGRVEYRTGAQKAEANLTPDYLKKREEIWIICMALGDGQEEVAKTFLKDATSFKSKDGKDVSADDIKKVSTEKWIDMTLRNVKASWKKAYPDSELPGGIK